ncbi:hypothetical protein KCP77_05260 [Salmonella enterica subsp. enterica]|nr:hypothetical protein KCP77_05260 [Salmonella enterica subsp. enterica]
MNRHGPDSHTEESKRPKVPSGQPRQEEKTIPRRSPSRDTHNDPTGVGTIKFWMASRHSLSVIPARRAG